jgi:hypothetical protein
MAAIPIIFIKQAKIKPVLIPIYKVLGFELQWQIFAALANIYYQLQ